MEWITNLPKRMRKAGVSVTELAAMTGLDDSAIHRLLNGATARPQAATMRKIDAALDGMAVSGDDVRTLRAEMTGIQEEVAQLRAAVQLLQSVMQRLLEGPSSPRARR